MPKIIVMPNNVEIEVEQGSNLRDSLLSKEIVVKSPCGGCASCGQCVVVVKSQAGDMTDSLNDISFEEKQILGNVFHLTGERLSCQTIVNDDVTIDISAHLETKKKPVVTKRRTREEADSIVEERKEKAKERPQRQGGLNRPKAFKIEKE